MKKINPLDPVINTNEFLALYDYNKTHAARALGVDIMTLHYTLKRGEYLSPLQAHRALVLFPELTN